MNNQRNIILAMALAALLLFGWEIAMSRLYPEPEEVTQAGQPDAPTEIAEANSDGTDAPVVKRTREGGLTDPGAIARETQTLEQAIAAGNRVPIDAPEIGGSINLVGGRIDDVTLKSHTQTVEQGSGPVRMFSPAGTPAEHFAQLGWAGQGLDLPRNDTLWRADGSRLTPETPVTLRWENGQGLTFSIRFEIDDEYMVTATQTVANRGTGRVALSPYATVVRTSDTASASTWTIRSGAISSTADEVSFSPDYDDLAEAGTVATKGNAAWLGFSDIYWLSAIVPQAGAQTDAQFRSLGDNLFRADAIYRPVTLAPGRQAVTQTRLFVGAKESRVLDAYEDAGIPKFGRAIDWGWFYWFERPIFWLLSKLYELVGNFGVAIIILTVIIRAILFPIAQKGFSSMAAMKAIQPKMKALQERYADDKPKMQQEVMALYKKEGVNPLSGCLPMLLQIPVFFALYKVLMLAIEMRHKPFALWIEDLSAPDPAHLFNLFGLLPFEVPALIAIGPLALLLGLTMWLTFRLNPSSMDPMQKQIFAIMPWVLMFVMAPFAAGLLLYWVTNNVLSIAQQQYLYSKHPQLRAQAEKEKADKERAAARDAKG